MARRQQPAPNEDARLSQELEAVFIEKRCTYGRGHLTREQRARGHTCGERRVGRLMRTRGLQTRPRRRFRPQTNDSRHDGPGAGPPSRWPGATDGPRRACGLTAIAAASTPVPTIAPCWQRTAWCRS